MLQLFVYVDNGVLGLPLPLDYESFSLKKF